MRRFGSSWTLVGLMALVLALAWPSFTSAHPVDTPGEVTVQSDDTIHKMGVAVVNPVQRGSLFAEIFTDLLNAFGVLAHFEMEPVEVTASRITHAHTTPDQLHELPYHLLVCTETDESRLRPTHLRTTYEVLGHTILAQMNSRLRYQRDGPVAWQNSHERAGDLLNFS